MTGCGSTLECARELASAIAAHAATIDRERAIPPELIARLRAAGCFRMAVARGYGGDELTLPELLSVVQLLARADGTVAWVVAQIALAQLVLSYLPIETLDRLYADGPDLIAAGAFAPKGHASHGEHGWEVTGRWPYVTGSEHASWIYVQCMITSERRVQVTASGRPATRVMVLPATEVAIERTWLTLGLRGTASHDVIVDHRTCTLEHSCTLEDRATLAGPLYRLPLRDCGGLFVAAVAAGVARAALDAIVAIARAGKRPAFGTLRLADDRAFQRDLGGAFMDQSAAVALLEREAGLAWSAVVANEPPPHEGRAILRATTGQVVALSLRATDSVHALARGSSIYEGTSLERMLRDIHTVSQHAWSSVDDTVVLGALLAGAPVDPAQFS